MFEKSAHTRHKNEARVVITLAGQEPFEASVFVKIDERLIDLLNDDRAFIPVKRSDGTTVITAKNNIVTIIEKAIEQPAPDANASPDAEEPAAEEPKEQPGAGAEEAEKPKFRQRRSFDPYDVLRVDRDASNEEIRRAYKARIKAVHPDTIAALDLDEDIAKAANQTAQKVNHAYQKIMREKNRTVDIETEAGAN